MITFHIALKYLILTREHNLCPIAGHNGQTVKPISDKRTQNQLFLKEYLTDPRKEVKLKTQTILNTLGVKIRDRNVSSNDTVPATDDNFGGSTGLAKKNARIGRYVYSISKE